MKILSITIHHVVNFGSVLQAYATQKLFEDKGADFVTLNYIPERLTFSYRFNEVLIKGKSPLYKRLATYLTMEVLNKKVFTDFLKKYVRLTAPFYLKDKGKKAVNADIFMTGSDQVWNSIHNKCVDTTYYWDFVKGKKVAFASSFGRSDIPDEEAALINKYLGDYALMSSREDTGVKILEKLQEGKHVEQLLDPTLLLKGEQWRSLAEYEEVDKRRKYVLIYPMSEVDPTLIEVARKIADGIHAEVWMLSPGLKTYKSCDRTLKFQSPERFLALIDGAACVVTNSFHGTVFAINFNRPFVSVAPRRFSTRITSILSLLKLDDRLYSGKLDLSDVMSIDYSTANTILYEERNKADMFINKIMSL